MKTRQLVCNDCGCRFEIKEAGKSKLQAAGAKAVEPEKARRASVSCPECQSYNVTTA